MATTAKKNKHIDELHFEHQLWVSEIKFYLDELDIYQQLLGKIISNSKDEEEKKQVEHFQNQFIIQKQQLSILDKDIKVHEQWLEEYSINNPSGIEYELFADHKLMRKKKENIQRIYSDLKTEFKRFLQDRLELLKK